jgi:hypothetical protein
MGAAPATPPRPSSPPGDGQGAPAAAAAPGDELTGFAPLLAALAAGTGAAQAAPAQAPGQDQPITIPPVLVAVAPPGLETSAAKPPTSGQTTGSPPATLGGAAPAAPAPAAGGAAPRCPRDGAAAGRSPARRPRGADPPPALPGSSRPRGARMPPLKQDKAEPALADAAPSLTSSRRRAGNEPRRRDIRDTGHQRPPRRPTSAAARATDVPPAAPAYGRHGATLAAVAGSAAPSPLATSSSGRPAARRPSPQLLRTAQAEPAAAAAPAAIPGAGAYADVVPRPSAQPRPGGRQSCPPLRPTRPSAPPRSRPRGRPPRRPQLPRPPRAHRAPPGPRSFR